MHCLILFPINRQGALLVVKSCCTSSTLFEDNTVAPAMSKRYLYVCYAVWLHEGLLVLAVLYRPCLHLQLHVCHSKHMLLQHQQA